MEIFPNAHAEKVAYQEHWRNNAAFFQEQGCYDWMAGQLAAIRPKKVLDLGCGTGEGIIALRKAFSCQVIGIDENESCLTQATERLKASNEYVSLAIRFEYKHTSNGLHFIRMKKSPIEASSVITLVQGDPLLDDPGLVAFLSSQSPFDAMIVWLIGSYNFRQSCASLSPLRISTPGDYRLRVQNRCYELAGRFLRSGGLLQVVDRGEEFTSEALMRDHLDGHKDQASVTDLEVLEVQSRPYVEHTRGKGVAMVTTLGASGRVPKLDKLFMHSVLSRKP